MKETNIRGYGRMHAVTHYDDWYFFSCFMYYDGLIFPIIIFFVKFYVSIFISMTLLT